MDYCCRSDKCVAHVNPWVNDRRQIGHADLPQLAQDLGPDRGCLPNIVYYGTAPKLVGQQGRSAEDGVIEKRLPVLFVVVVEKAQDVVLVNTRVVNGL